MAKKLLCIVALLLTVVFLLASCDNGDDAPNTPENPAHTHSYGEWEIQKAATCTTEGSKDRYCSCGEKQTASISATGHSFGGWTTVKEPTQTETGTQERSCSCGEKETKTLDKIAIVNTVSSNEWKNIFSDFGNGDFSTVTIEIDETTTEVSDNETYGYDVTVVADFNRNTYSISGIDFWNNEIDTINVFGNERLDSDNHFYTDWMHEFYSEIEYRADWGYSQFSYDSASVSYRATMEIDDVSCNVNICFENGKLMKIALTSATSGDITLSSVYTYTYN